MQPTKLLYMEDIQMLTCEATIQEIQNENGQDTVILDQTCFYPQGGGQPYDQGIIETNEAQFSVKEVRFIDGIIKHIGTFSSDSKFKPGDTVECAVIAERRNLHARLHSGGHIVDMGVTALGLGWVPGKGYHFPDGPYVQYSGMLDENGREELKNNLEKKCNEFIAEERETTIQFMPKEEMHTVCHHVPDYIPEGKPARVVMYGNFGVPCGGTHVKNLREVRAITIRKIKIDHGNIQVSYDVAR